MHCTIASDCENIVLGLWAENFCLMGLFNWFHDLVVVAAQLAPVTEAASKGTQATGMTNFLAPILSGSSQAHFSSSPSSPLLLSIIR